MFCLAGSSTSMSRGHLTNGRGMSEATKPVIKYAVFRETLAGITVDCSQCTRQRDRSIFVFRIKLLREMISRLELE